MSGVVRRHHGWRRWLGAAAPLLAGCGVVTTEPVDGTFALVDPTIFAGQEAELTLLLEEPAGAGGLRVPLLSSNQAILALPTSVELAPGERERTVVAQAGIAGGPVLLTARIGGLERRLSATVLPPPAIELTMTPSSVWQLSTGELLLEGTASHPRALDEAAVTVDALDDDAIALGLPVLTADGTDFRLTVPVSIAVDAEPGAASIFVDTNGPALGGQAELALTVMRIPRVLQIDPAAAQVDTTDRRTLTVVLDQAARPGGETVWLESAAPAVTDVETSVVVPEGELEADFDVVGGSAGGPVAVTAQLADGQAASSVTIADAVLSGTTVTAGGGAYQTETVTLVASGLGSSPVAVDAGAFTLSAAGGSGLALAGSELAGSHLGWTLTVEISVAAAAPPGTALLVLDGNGGVPGGSVSIPFVVRELPRVSRVGPDGSVVDVGSDLPLTVTLTAPARAGGETVTIACDDPSIVVPPTVTVSEGATDAAFDVGGTAEGTATVTATLNGGSDGTVVRAALVQSLEVVVTEFVALGDERIELTNVSGSGRMIQGWTIETRSSGAMSIRSAAAPGDPGVALVLTNGAIAFGVPNPADPADIPAGAAFVWGEPGTPASIDDAGDRLRLMSGPAALSDEVDFGELVADAATPVGAASFPARTSASTQLGLGFAGAPASDDGGSWCVTFRAPHSLGESNHACDGVVINEVNYDPAGSDDGSVFVELAGPGGTSIGGAVVRWINNADGAIRQPVTIPAGTRLPADGLFVLADTTAAGATTVTGADLTTASFNPDNGPGESIQLLDAEGNLLDVVQYGAGGPAMAADGTAAVEGLYALEGSDNTGSALARDADSTDTGDNRDDFGLDSTPTPGSPNG